MLDTTGSEACDDEDSVRVFVWLFGCLLRRRLGGVGWVFKLKTTLKTSVQIDDAADCARSLDLTCIICYKRVSVAEHLHNLSPYSLHSMIEVSAKAKHAILYTITVTPWQYPPRHGMLFFILSRLCSICRGLASAEAWHAILYPITPWQYPPRLGMLFYILSRLGSIRQDLAFYYISYHALAVSAGAWYAILYLVTPWQYPTKDQPPKTQATKAQVERTMTAQTQAPKTRATESSSWQTETCRCAGIRGTLLTCWGGCRFRKWQRILWIHILIIHIY